jgi:hypothetical protein
MQFAPKDRNNRSRNNRNRKSPFPTTPLLDHDPLFLHRKTHIGPHPTIPDS